VNSKLKTRTFRLNKLVRDKIVQSTEEQGGSAEHRVLEAEELRRALLNKLNEELVELMYGHEPDLEKLADIGEVIEGIAVSLGKTVTELHAVQYDKRRKVGGFTTGVYVETVTLPEGNEWVDYYASNPIRFPEVK
jgi:predicted house-cleaning noncanonical NTP pyrophosphatase (MazG superfamily)